MEVSSNLSAYHSCQHPAPFHGLGPALSCYRLNESLSMLLPHSFCCSAISMRDQPAVCQWARLLQRLLSDAGQRVSRRTTASEQENAGRTAGLVSSSARRTGQQVLTGIRCCPNMRKGGGGSRTHAQKGASSCCTNKLSLSSLLASRCGSALHRHSLARGRRRSDERGSGARRSRSPILILRP